MLPCESVLQIHRDNKELFAEKYDATKIGLFGSFARNEASDESNIDVCVDVRFAQNAQAQSHDDGSIVLPIKTPRRRRWLLRKCHAGLSFVI